MKEKLDYKKEYKDLYLPKKEPVKIQVPPMKYIIVEGKGNPNEENGEYKKAIEILYGLSYTIKMSKMGSHPIDGYFEYVVPPLEGFWWIDGQKKRLDYSQKEQLRWFSVIRQPEFVTKEVFNWAKGELKKKKPELDVSKAFFEEIEEGLCVQMMHIGSYDEEPKTIDTIEKFIKENQLENDIESITRSGFIRRHHEIYLSDPSKAKPENLKIVIRIPVKEK